MGKPFLQCHHRRKDGKDHCYWSIAEKVRVASGHWVQRPILYLGEINDSQKAAWTKVIDVFDATAQQTIELALYPVERAIPAHVASGVQVRLSEFSLHRSRQWGACWMGCQLWDQLQLDRFWQERLAPSREGTDWKNILQTLTIYRLIALVVTPEGFPLAYEVMPGNTSDKTTLQGFLEKIEQLYGKAERIWVTCLPAGRWTGVFRPKRFWNRCVRVNPRFIIWWGRRAAN